jgi:predicted RNA-binding protein (virulence factor B family)
MNREEIVVKGIKEAPEKVDFKPGDEVSILIYRFTDIGIKVIINDQYFGLVYENDIYKKFEVGDETKGYIKKIRADNKIDVILRKPGYGRIEEAKQTILNKLKEKDGFIPLNDNSSPELIKEELQMSKGSFKKAIGGLYKEKIINITDQGIKIK